jgi:hypothetical protein
MFNDYTTTRVLVADRQTRLHHEAEQHRLGRLARRRRRATSTSPAVAAEQPIGIAAAAPRLDSPEHRTAA